MIEMTPKLSHRQLLFASTALLVANIGSSTFSFAMGLFLLKNYSSAAVFGLSQAIGPVVSLLIAPILRTFIDKVSKQRIISAAQLLSICGLLLFAVLLQLFKLDLIVAILFILVVLRIADQIFDVAYMASVTLIVNQHDIPKLKSYEQMVSSFSTIVGPVLGAACFTAFGMNFTIFIVLELLCELSALIVMRWLKFRAEPQITAAAVTQNELAYIFHDHLLFFAIWLGSAINFFYSAFSIGLPYIQIHILKLSSQVYGFSEAAMSIGILLTSLVLSRKSSYAQPLFTSWRTAVGFSGLFLVMGSVLMIGLPSKLIFSIFIISFNLIMGMVLAVLDTPVLVWMTERIPNELQGRVFNIMRTTVQVLMPIGIIIASWSFDHVAAGSVFLVSGILFVLIVVLYPRFFNLSLKGV